MRDSYTVPPPAASFFAGEAGSSGVPKRYRLVTARGATGTLKADAETSNNATTMRMDNMVSADNLKWNIGGM